MVRRDEVTVTAGAQTAETAEVGAAAALGAPRVIGAVVGRFTIVSLLGSGGMGTVYRAYDPVLDRAVALKVLHHGSDPQRLLREAQALARLQHPNVLTVHEAGVDRGEPYLATELVDGADLAHWLAGEPRDRADILEVFAAAGRGLAAAHAVGLVHRDFKPSNVLVGDDGRVRVADLGIARGVPSGTGGELDEDAAAAGGGAGRRASTQPLLDTPLTVTGSIVGTPAYMAPEQAEGRPADARSDQFSFCVSLWEALAGRRPFHQPWPARIEEIQRGPVDEPGTTAVPARLRRALVRGLAHDSDARFPSMDALMAALFPRGRGGLWLGLGAGAIIAVVAGLALWSRAPAATCTGFEPDLAGAWDASARRAVEAAFAASIATSGQDALRAEHGRAEAALDAYARAWIAERTDACTDTRVRGGQSAAVMDLRMACLDRLHLELGALTQLLAAGGDDVLGRSTSAVLALRPPSLCAHADAFAARPAPADEGGRARLARVEAGLAELKALHDAARHRDGLARIDAVLVDARALAAPALVAETLFWRGKMLRQLDQYDPSLAAYREAASAAEAAGRDRLRFEITVKALDIAGYFHEDRGQTAWLSDAARGIIGRLGSPPDLTADLAESLSNAEIRFGRLDLARAHVDEMMALRRGVVPEDQPLWARTLRAYARVTQLQGELDITDRYMTQALAIMERHLGPDHPDLGYYLNVIGILHRQRGELDAAEQTFRRLIAADVRAYGPDNGKTGRTWNNLGGVLLDAGRPAEALDAYQRALAIHAASVGPTSALYASTATALARAHLALGQLDDARARADEALAIYAARPDDRDVVGALLVAARIDAAQGDRAAALARATTAVTTADGDPASPARSIDPLVVRAELLLAAGRAADAQADLERALALLDAHPQAPADRAAAELDLARAVAARDPARARALAIAARDRLGPTPVGAAADLRAAAARFLDAR